MPGVGSCVFARLEFSDLTAVEVASASSSKRDFGTEAQILRHLVKSNSFQLSWAACAGSSGATEVTS